MNAQTPIQSAAALGTFERTEALMGRTRWTFADYVEEGRRQFDNRGPGQPGTERLGDSMREEFAKAYARLVCPPAKLRAHVASRNAEFATPAVGRVA